MQVKDGYLQPLLSEEGWLQSAPWTEAWGLRTEPFVVVIDADGPGPRQVRGRRHGRGDRGRAGGPLTLSARL